MAVWNVHRIWNCKSWPTYHLQCVRGKLFISHALDCNKSGLITTHHNKLRDRVADLVSKAFTPSHVHNEVLIHIGGAMQSVKAHHDSQPRESFPSPNNLPVSKEDSGDKVYILTQDLWQKGAGFTTQNCSTGMCTGHNCSMGMDRMQERLKTFNKQL